MKNQHYFLLMRLFCAHLPVEAQPREVTRLLESHWNALVVWHTNSRHMAIVLLPYCDPNQSVGGLGSLLRNLDLYSGRKLIENYNPTSTWSAEEQIERAAYKEVAIAFLKVGILNCTMIRCIDFPPVTGSALKWIWNLKWCLR